MEEISEKLQDALSIISLLENDMEAQKAEEIHIRAVKVLHKLLFNVCEEVELTFSMQPSS